MKKLLVLIAALMCAVFLSTAALAANGDAVTEQADSSYVPNLSDGVPGRGSIESPLDYWGANGYPDDVSYAFNAGGKMADDDTILHYWQIGLKNATDERKEELAEMFSSACLLTFEDARYSYNERAAVLEQIEETQVKQTHDKNYVSGQLGANTDVVYIVVKDAVYDEYAARYAEDYGDMVQTCKESEQAYATQDMIGGVMTGGAMPGGVMPGGGIDVGGTESGSEGINPWLTVSFVCGGVILIFVAVALYLRRTKLVPARQTVDGQTVTGEKTLTHAETVAAVRESEYTPNDSVLDEIKDKL